MRQTKPHKLHSVFKISDRTFCGAHTYHYLLTHTTYKGEEK